MSFKNAIVCLNGHILTRDSAANSSYKATTHCPKCGLELINICPRCNAPIHGQEINSIGQRIISTKPADSFCYNCGTPYPWTESEFEKAELIINELDDLTTAEKEKLCRSLIDLYNETPKTDYAVLLAKKAMMSCKGILKDVFKDMLVGFCCATVKTKLGIT